MTRVDPVFLLIVLAALALRLFLAATEPYVHDEINTAIPLADTISFAPGALNLPLRGENHGALPAYVVHASRSLFGTSPLSSRLLHVLLGLCTVGLVYLLARRWYGAGAGRWAAALMAFNGFYLDVSSRATAHVPHLFFVAAAVYAFSRFMADQRPAFLYAAGASLGLAFYCKEHSALLLPLFFLALLHPSCRAWLWRPQPYLAFLVWAAVISPDLLWNVRGRDEPSRIAYGSQEAAQATYASHLQRVGGLGLSPYPAMFYGRSAVVDVYRRLTGRELRDETPEYRSIHPLLGAIMLGAVLFTTVRHPAAPAATPLLLLAFWGVFVFFTLIDRGDPPGRLDPVSWIWVESTLIPAAVLTGTRIQAATGLPRIAVVFAAAAVLALTAATPARELISAGVDSSREGYSLLSHLAQVLAQTLVVQVRQSPLRAVALALAAGVVLGWGAGSIIRARRS